MVVYVDRERNSFGRMIMCHMVADTIGELLDMADRIGLHRRHFQPDSHPHFDVSTGYRAKAVKAGAVEVDRRGLVEIMKRQSLRLKEDPAELAAFYQAESESTKSGLKSRSGRNMADMGNTSRKNGKNRNKTEQNAGLQASLDL